MQEAAVVAELPLPPQLDKLYNIFLALNAVHSFLLSHHIQVWALSLCEYLTYACQQVLANYIS